LACGEGLEGDHDVVRASEFEGMEAQTVLSTPFTSMCGLGRRN
jgi:hypothetical protein